jgi:conjugative relaxase-like TrwC/TraI family protein
LTVLHLARVADSSARYYLDDLGDELARVAPGHGADAGRWMGGGTAGLGLSGPVDGPMLRALLDGGHPRTGHSLASRQHRSVAGFDLVFSAPKSVSLYLAVGDRGAADSVLVAHREAVDAAVDHLERRALAVRRSTDEHRVPQPTSGMVGASFTHCLSRAGDPHLHTHVLMANLAHGADGRWSAIDSRGPFAHARALGALYDAHLRAEVTDRLGVSWSWHDGRGWDVDGTDPLVLAAFSGRAAEIRQELAGWGSSSARARHVAWASTRDQKDPSLRSADLAERWSRRASIAPGWRWERAPVRGAPPDRLEEPRFAAAIAACPPSGVCRRDGVAAWSNALPAGARGDELDRAVEHWAPGDEGSLGVAEPRRAPASCVPASHHLRTLGARPVAAEGQPIWRHAAAAIDRYRARWGIEGDRRALGAEREHLAGFSHPQLADHLDVARTVRDALVRLGVDPRARLEREGLAVERR